MCLFGPCILQRLKQAFQKQIQQVQLIALQVHYDRLNTFTPWMNSQFEGIQAETPVRDGPDQYSLPGGLFWLGDHGRGWDIKQ